MISQLSYHKILLHFLNHIYWYKDILFLLLIYNQEKHHPQYKHGDPPTSTFHEQTPQKTYKPRLAVRFLDSIFQENAHVNTSQYDGAKNNPGDDGSR